MTLPYTLMLGDCLELLPSIAARSVDAVICDPPYGTTACKWDSPIPFAPNWMDWPMFYHDNPVEAAPGMVCLPAGRSGEAMEGNS